MMLSSSWLLEPILLRASYSAAWLASATFAEMSLPCLGYVYLEWQSIAAAEFVSVEKGATVLKVLRLLL